jgi:chromosome segregation ATPase
MSNSELIAITHKKILEDQEYLISEISILTSSISETKATLDRLQEEEERTDPAERENETQPDNAEDHIQWVYWLKKRYKEFTDLTLKIRQNETKLKYMKQKLRYYRQNLETFLNKYKHAFYKTQKTTFRAYFEGCYNSAA